MFVFTGDSDSLVMCFQDTEVKYPRMIVVEGALSSSVYTYLPGVVHVTTLYNISGLGFCILVAVSDKAKDDVFLFSFFSIFLF